MNVSEATVVRCARAIGFDGFPHLRRSLQEIFRSRVTPATRLRRKLADLKDGHVLLKTVEMELRYLHEVPHSIPPVDFDRAVQVLLAARRVFALGLGPARILPELLEIRLRRFGIPTPEAILGAGWDRLVQVLDRRREEVAGVSLDEEAAMMLRYQRAYE
ncbi:MAG: hypothetical protein K6U89_17675, partial [Chloroflexi bacterium]|nr:hypothetical protein [Chloroflexota bacterium]